MSKVNIKKIYENAVLENDYGIKNEEDKKEETSEKKPAVTADSLVKDMMKLEPNLLLKFIAKQEDQDAKAWLLKNLLSFAKYVVKNGYVKGKALVGAVKNIGNKNKEDETGIDYDNIEIDETSLKTKYAFDEETVNKLKNFIDDYKKEMESAKDDIEKSCGELDKDIKKAGVKIEGDKLADNTLTVVSVIDDDKNKGKSGKEMTKLVDNKIETDKKVQELSEKADLIETKMKSIKVDSSLEKLSIEELEKKAKEKKNDKQTSENEIAEGQLTEAENPTSVDNIAAAIAIKTAELVKNNSDVNEKDGLEAITNWVANTANEMDYDNDMTEELKDRAEMIYKAAQSGKDLTKIAKEYTTDTAMKIAEKMASISLDDNGLALDDYSYKSVKKLADIVAKGAAGEIEDMMSHVSIDGNKIRGFDSSGILNNVCKELKVKQTDLAKLLEPSSHSSSLTMSHLSDKMKLFLVLYEKNPTKAIKTLTQGVNPNKKDALIEIACKIKPNATKDFKNAGFTVDGAINKLSNVGSAAKDVGSAAKAAVVSQVDGVKAVEVMGGIGLVDDKGHGIIMSDMIKQVNKFDQMAFDGIDAKEFKQISDFEGKLTSLEIWANENQNSKDPRVLAHVAAIRKTALHFNETMYGDKGNLTEYLKAADRALAGRIPEAGENNKNIAKMANNEETKKVTQGFMGKLGKALRVFGQAKMVAKFGKFILNDGKAGIDAIGGQYVKFKEDQNVVAEMEFILMNDKDSKSKHSDTKFSCRFDTSDMKWHMTNLDDRKQKIEKEDVLIKKVLEQEESKKFKEECLKSWSDVFEPKDEASKFVPYFIKNYDKLGVDIKDKNMKKYFGTLLKLVSNFDEVKKQFN